MCVLNKYIFFLPTDRHLSSNHCHRFYKHICENHLQRRGNVMERPNQWGYFAQLPGTNRILSVCWRGEEPRWISIFLSGCDNLWEQKQSTFDWANQQCSRIDHQDRRKFSPRPILLLHLEQQQERLPTCWPTVLKLDRCRRHSRWRLTCNKRRRCEQVSEHRGSDQRQRVRAAQQHEQRRLLHTPVTGILRSTRGSYASLLLHRIRFHNHQSRCSE